MAEMIVRLYDRLGKNRKGMMLSFFLITVVLAVLVCRQTYKEDISDFLPLNNKYHRALKVYQDVSGADRIIVIFQQRDTTLTDPDRIVEAVEKYVALWGYDDSIPLTYQIDMDMVKELSQSLYEQMPYVLTTADYARFDSLLSREDYVATQLAEDKQMLLFPVGGLLSENFQRDPLNLFTPVVQAVVS